jgi:predicted dehydrogenase
MATKSASLRFGVVGAGAISRSSCASINNHADARIIAAWDPHAGRLGEICDKYDIAHKAESAEKLFARTDIDAVYIGVPNKFHAPLAIQALKAGKHVILDKPFALNLKEAREVVATAEKMGVKFMVGMNQRFGRAQQQLKSLVEQGVLGEVYHAKSFWFRRAGIPRLHTWFGDKEQAGGGALLDIGVHLLDLALYLTDNFEPIGAYGQVYTKFGNRELGEGGWGLSDRDPSLPFTVDDFASATIRMKNGMTVALDVTWACHQEESSKMDVQLYGTEAGAVAYGNKLFRFADAEIGRYEVIQGPAGGKVKYEHCDRFHNFINAVLGREETCVTTRQALAVQSILDAIYESASTGQAAAIKG